MGESNGMLEANSTWMNQGWKLNGKENRQLTGGLLFQLVKERIVLLETISLLYLENERLREQMKVRKKFPEREAAKDFSDVPLPLF